MGIVLDIVIVALFSLSVFLGYKKGLVGVAFKILSFIVALVLAFILSRPVTNIVIENTEFDEGIHKTIESTLASKSSEELEENKEESNTSNVITDYVAGQIKKATSEAQDNIAVTVADGLTENIVYAICFIGIFIVLRIILIFLKFLAEAIAEIPVLKQFNEAGGIAYGVLRGVFIIFLFFAIVSLVASIADIGGFLDIINESFIGKILYNNNLLLKILF